MLVYFFSKFFTNFAAMADNIPNIPRIEIAIAFNVGLGNSPTPTAFILPNPKRIIEAANSRLDVTETKISRHRKNIIPKMPIFG